MNIQSNPGANSNAGTNTNKLPLTAIAALENGQLIEAIKLTRASNHLGLKEAKEEVESYLEQHPMLRERFRTAAANQRSGFLRIATVLLLVAVLAWLFWPA